MFYSFCSVTAFPLVQLDIPVNYFGKFPESNFTGFFFLTCLKCNDFFFF